MSMFVPANEKRGRFNLKTILKTDGTELIPLKVPQYKFKIKTITSQNKEKFDRLVNAELDKGWRVSGFSTETLALGKSIAICYIAFLERVIECDRELSDTAGSGGKD